MNVMMTISNTIVRGNTGHGARISLTSTALSGCTFSGNGHDGVNFQSDDESSLGWGGPSMHMHNCISEHNEGNGVTSRVSVGNHNGKGCNIRLASLSTCTLRENGDDGYDTSGLYILLGGCAHSNKGMGVNGYCDLREVDVFTSSGNGGCDFGATSVPSVPSQAGLEWRIAMGGTKPTSSGHQGTNLWWSSTRSVRDFVVEDNLDEEDS